MTRNVWFVVGNVGAVLAFGSFFMALYEWPYQFWMAAALLGVTMLTAACLAMASRSVR